MRFDWYSATLKENPDQILRVFSRSFDLSECLPVRAKNGFHHASQVRLGDRVLSEVAWGGKGVGGLVHVQGTGESGQLVADVMRDRFPVHRVTRADIAEDYDDPTAWAFWSGCVERLARSSGLNYRLLQNGLNGEGGRTIYVGSLKSVVQLRVYEKGKKDGGSPGWVRVELVVRPKRKEARQRLSAAPYRDFFGCARWSQSIAETMGLEEVPRLRAGSVYRLSDMEQKRQALVRQYGKTIEAWLSELGGDSSELGVQLWHLIASEKQHQQQQQKYQMAECHD